MSMDMQQLAKQFGTVTFEGKTYTLTAQADYTNRVFPAWYGDASEGESYTTEFDCEALDDAGNLYRVVWQFEVVKGEEPEPDNHNWDDVAFVELIEEATDDDDSEPSKWSQVYDHPTLRHYVPSEKTPHISALEAAGLLDALTVEQLATVIKIAQTAYQNGQHSQGAERIDNDAVWIDGVGGLERQEDGAWRLTMPDNGFSSMAAATLGRTGGATTSDAKAAAARANGKRGGRPRKKAE